MNLYWSWSTFFFVVLDTLFSEIPCVFGLNAEVFWLSLSSLTSYINMTLIIKALKLESPANVGLFSSTNILFALIGDYFLLGINIQTFKIIGAFVFLVALKLLHTIKS